MKKKHKKMGLKHHWRKLKGWKGWKKASLWRIWKGEKKKLANARNIRAEKATFLKLKKEANMAFMKLKKDFLKKRMPEVIFDDLKKLRYRLGECNWKIRELQRARQEVQNQAPRHKRRRAAA
jgi:hypothetical protein